MWILEGNEKFQKRKCAYFLQKIRGKGSFKHIFIFFQIPPSGPWQMAIFAPKKFDSFLKALEYVNP